MTVTLTREPPEELAVLIFDSNEFTRSMLTRFNNKTNEFVTTKQCFVLSKGS